MVFHAAAETTETPPAPARPSPMASSAFASKPQPLHGFAFSDLKWSVNHSTANPHLSRFRNKLPDSELRVKSYPMVKEDQQHHHRRVIRKPPESILSVDSEPRVGSPFKNDHQRVFELGGSSRKVSESENRNHKVRNGVKKPGVPETQRENSEKKSKNAGCVLEKPTASDAKSKIFVRIRTKNKSDAGALSGGTTEALDQTSAPDATPETDEPAPKTWNLRPRKPLKKRPNSDGGATSTGEAPKQDPETQHPGRAETSRARNGTDPKVPEKKRPKLSISLTKEEIEEDIFAFTGSKPARRPKKRARNVQKQLDIVFPGLWLGSITPETYKVADAPAKG